MERLIPPPLPAPGAGWAPAGVGPVRDVILFVLTSGCLWRALPIEMDFWVGGEPPVPRPPFRGRGT